MDERVWKVIRVAIRTVDRSIPRIGRRPLFSDQLIVRMYFWTVAHDRPRCWARRRSSYSRLLRPRSLPSVSQFCKRLKTARVITMIRRVHELLAGLDEPIDLAFIDGKALPVSRRVAFKILKPGMDSRQVLARFEAERHTLALMDHPNIARVLDASTTVTGRPLFVMELVDGLPITRFCDEHKLTLRELLKLFRTVCAAVQHAHQKGIIHRDIKPSNVMVTLRDGAPVPT